PIAHVDALREALRNGHPILHDVDLPDWGRAFSETLCNETGSAGSVSARVERFTAHSTALDRLRAVELVHTATALLSLALASHPSSERLARLFDSAVPAPASPADGTGTASPSDGTAAVSPSDGTAATTPAGGT